MAERTCLACRKVLRKDELVRYVAAPGGVLTVDYTSRLPGRGAYTCVSTDCIAKAVERKQFARALKTELTPVETQHLVDQLTSAVEAKVAALLGMARKSGLVLSGTNDIQASLRGKRQPGLVILATDLAPSLDEKITALAVARQVPVYTMFSKDDLGRLLGKGLRSTLAVQPGGLADRLIAELDRYQTVLGEK